MNGPNVLQQPYVALHHVPYQIGEAATEATLSNSGVLPSGQTVWTTKDFSARAHRRVVTAFVDDIGTVSLDPSWLIRADVLKPSTKEQLMAKAVKSFDKLPDVIADVNQSDEQESTLSVMDEQIAERAYSLWEQGGSQEGTAELDWSRAKDELSKRPA